MVAKDNAKLPPKHSRLCLTRSICCTTAINDLFAFMFDNKNAFASHRIGSHQIKSKSISTKRRTKIGQTIHSITLKSIEWYNLVVSPKRWRCCNPTVGSTTIASNVIAAFMVRIITPTVILCMKVFVFSSLKGNMDDW